MKKSIKTITKVFLITCFILSMMASTVLAHNEDLAQEWIDTFTFTLPRD